MSMVSPPRAVSKKTGKEVDPLLSKLARYRKDAGLTVADFNNALSKQLEQKLKSRPTKSALASAPKFLAYLQQFLSAAEIETGFANVLADYA